MSKKKNKNQQLTRKIQKHLREHPTKTYNHKQIASVFGFTSTQDRNAVITALQKLKAQKEIVESQRGSFQWNGKNAQYFDGKLEITGSGNGYVVL